MTVARWEIAKVDRANCDDDEGGSIKPLSDRRGTIIGATIVARAGEGPSLWPLAPSTTSAVRTTAASVPIISNTPASESSRSIACATWIARSAFRRRDRVSA